DPGGHREPERQGVVEPLCRGALHGFCQTETCLVESAEKGERFQSAHRSRSSRPARRAMRSSSEGKTERNGIDRRSHTPSRSVKWWDALRCVARSYSSKPTCVSERSKTPSGRAVGTPTSTTKLPPGSRCAAAFAKVATCPSCDVLLMIELKTMYTRENVPSTRV